MPKHEVSGKGDIKLGFIGVKRRGREYRGQSGTNLSRDMVQQGHFEQVWRWEDVHKLTVLLYSALHTISHHVVGGH